MRTPTALLQLSSHQAGAVSLRQALAHGLTEPQWVSRLHRGRWQRLVPGVAITHDGPVDDVAWLWGALLHAGPAARLTGDAALRLLGMRISGSERIDIAVPSGHPIAVPAEARRRGVVHVRCRALGRLPESHLDLPTLRADAALLHAAALAPTARAAEWRVIAACQQRLTAVPLVRATLREMPKVKRRRLVHEVLDEVEGGVGAASELAFVRFLDRNGLPRPDSLQRRVRLGSSTHYLDARYDRVGITIEVDGHHHADAGQWEADALRSLRVQVALPGERVLRITPGMMRHDEAELAELLRRLLHP